METDLKKDLKKVKDKIKGGIDGVLRSMNVLTLDGFVKSDLKTLKGKISELGNGLEGDGKSNELVKDKLEALAKEKRTLYDIAGERGKIITETDGLGEKFKTVIQQPLDEKAKAVDSAIGTLGGKFDLKGDKNIHEVFGHIKEEVGKIKGQAGSKGGNGKWHGNSGLDGIKERVKDLAQAFVKTGWSGFNARVEG
ncbi:Mitochondrial ornithine transporter, putative [Babesia ovata]|uniref:Mitochondrial ornithine transporter, putative n=1 Tax=Babesia ovata TaxID=189622 RepID=A0A2H6KDB9_9APIC|nr:Mitochondrial ornithine transporter, putative [Babesia ovata]GBE60986.1 Mitochondrial ornithine transporter, putative [Babesia ovata]